MLLNYIFIYVIIQLLFYKNGKRYDMKENFLSREEIKDVIEGRGFRKRVPMAVHFWIDADRFGAQSEEYKKVLDQYPCDVLKMTIQMPEVFTAPEDEASFRWLNKDNPFLENQSLDAVSAIEDLEELDDIIAHFPDPYSVHIMPDCPKEDGRYRVCHWWYWMFERFWSLRGMENALCDFYEDPERVHQLFRALTDFYKVIVTRARKELHADAIFTSDDIGTQTGPFFSLDIFREFFKPYYKELIEHCHKEGMHFWMHSCGNIELFIPDLIEIGLDVIHPIQKYTMEEVEIAEKYGEQICIWGGFDVQQTIPFGSVEDVKREVRFMLDTYVKKNRRFILAAGNNMTEDTPLNSLEALLEEGISYGKEKISKL